MQIRAEEISQIIRKEIEGFDQKVAVTETGTVLEAGDGIARVYGLGAAMAGELLEFGKGVVGLVLNLEEDNVGVVLLGSFEADPGRRHRQAHRQDRPGAGGRRADRPRGQRARRPIDGKGPIDSQGHRARSRSRRPASSRASRCTSRCRPASRPSTR